MERLTADSPVRALPGVGDARSAAFARMGVHTLRDLVYHLPRAYENRGRVRLLKDGLDGTPSSFLLTVATEPRSAQIRRGMSVVRFRAFDDSGSVEVVFFNQNYVCAIFHVGSCFRFYGTLRARRGTPQLVSPAYEPVLPDRPLPAFVPRYPLSENLSGRIVEKTVAAALRALLPSLQDFLPEEIRRRLGFPTLSYALLSVHAPADEQSLSRALRRLVFDELFCFSLGMGLSRSRRAGSFSFPCPPCDPAPLLQKLPYRLTRAQERVFSEIRDDMRGGDRPPMSRILVGDVGSGKTVCAALAIYCAAMAGGQSVLMVPTEILARQHFADLSPLLASLGLRTGLLLGACTKKEKERICSETAEGKLDLLIGTHALLNDKLHFPRLCLIVTDEQHRFGVRQRALLREKESAAHLLVMSATPIPRTLALTLYGDLDISRLDEMPPGRQRVDTYVVNESYRERLNRFIRRQVEEGGQVYVVCPAIEEEEERGNEPEENDEELKLDRLDLLTEREERPPLKAATVYAAQLQKEVFPDLHVDFLHGKMKSAEKEAVMQRFVEGHTDILVSTTVIEVGVNVPRASLMIVENAERFGLSQLHQLRGRVGRGTRKSYCVLVSDAHGEAARARLEVMRTTYDGYAIAERDLEQRGPGDFFSSFCDSGLRQSGGMSLHLLRLCSDTSLMESAAREARALLASDPGLQDPQHTPLRSEVDRLFRIKESTLS